MRDLISFLRQNGVLQCSVGGVNVVLAPDAPVNSVDIPDAPKETSEKRADGLTKQEQIDLYGREME